MKRLLARTVRVSPAMVVAMLALFLALTGTTVAATTKLITGRQIQNNSITGLDVKNKSLTAADFRGSVRGPKGDKGDAGRSALSPLQSGETVRGVIAGTGTAGNQAPVIASVSLPVPAPVALDPDHVAVNGFDEKANECSGTYTNPTAAPGFVCIYLVSWSGNASLISGRVPAPTPYGFYLFWAATGSGPSSAEGSWAYTAP